MKKSCKSLGLFAVGMLLFQGGSNANAGVPFAPKNVSPNVYRCSSNSGVFELALKTEDSLGTVEKLTVTLERLLHNERFANSGIAFPLPPEEYPTRVYYVAGPFTSKTTGVLGEHALTFIATSATTLRGKISGAALSGHFQCQAINVTVIGKAQLECTIGKRPDFEGVKAEADESAKRACYGLYAERTSDYEEAWGDSLLPGGTLLYSVSAYYSCQDRPQ